MPRINQLPTASSVAQTDVLAIDTPNKTYQVPRSVLAPSPYVATIPSGQWSGSSGDYYITVTASNVTADSILIPHFDADSEANLQGPVWCVPAAGSFTIHTNTLPIGTVTILVQFIGIMGEAQYQVLADVYSTSQAVAKADIVDNLNSTNTDKPLSAAMGKQIKDNIGSTSEAITPTAGDNVTINDSYCYRIGKIVTINISFTMTADATSTQQLIKGLPQPAAAIPIIAVRNLGGGGYQCTISQNGNITNNYDAIQSGKKYFINATYAITNG